MGGNNYIGSHVPPAAAALACGPCHHTSIHACAPPASWGRSRVPCTYRILDFAAIVAGHEDVLHWALHPKSGLLGGDGAWQAPWRACDRVTLQSIDWEESREERGAGVGGCSQPAYLAQPVACPPAARECNEIANRLAVTGRAAVFECCLALSSGVLRSALGGRGISLALPHLGTGQTR
jgi:hypothetical protein